MVILGLDRILVVFECIVGGCIVHCFVSFFGLSFFVWMVYS